LIIEELSFYQFFSYEVDDMTISMEDFAKSIISYIPAGKINSYLERMEEIKF
jgi:hypothetical protein